MNDAEKIGPIWDLVGEYFIDNNFTISEVGMFFSYGLTSTICESHFTEQEVDFILQNIKQVFIENKKG